MRLYPCVKRLFDVVISGLALLILSPLMLIVALFVWCQSKGPAIFRQERVGKNQTIFTMYKFRSMVVGAEADGVYSDSADPRLTCIGRILRATSLDELPQLWNILKAI